VLAAAGVDATETQRLGHLMMRAELDGVVVSGPRLGKQATYALLDERAPIDASGPRWSRDQALVALATRYFTSRGPAMLRDFAWWSGLTVAEGRRAVLAAGDALRSETIDGAEYWSGPSRRIGRARPPIAHLLSNYDEYFIAYKDRSALSATPVRRQWEPGLNDHVLAIDGRLVGRWTRTITKAGVVLDVRSVRRLTTPERHAVDEQGERFGAFLGLPARVRIHV
jgi:hypothetical protein